MVELAEDGHAKKKLNKLRGLSLQANYTNRLSDCHLLAKLVPVVMQLFKNNGSFTV
jgi:hypothetical protein